MASQVSYEELRDKCKDLANDFIGNVHEAGFKTVHMSAKIKQWGVKVKICAWRKGGCYAICELVFQVIKDCDLLELREVLNALENTWCTKEIVSEGE